MRAGSSAQPASAWERDPCGQDGSAGACRLSGRDAGPPAPVSTVASVSPPPAVAFPARGADYYAAKTLEWIGYTLIAFDLANTVTGALAGPDTGLLGGPLVAAGIQLRHASARPETVVIGESMRRVRAYADELSAQGIKVRTYLAPNMTRSSKQNPYGSMESMDANWHWIDHWVRKRGAQVIDIGPQPGRTTPSPYYRMERRNIDRWERQGQIPPVTRVDPGY